ncbi:uncharacterized protein LOC129286503 [Prosopis cineraria]|uniref:uncharacterized protein LOC129286503 n=1 Tax=Prosopis cineraria TaxID=364024 RepID=UPI00240F759C|nr:uncharacterized protein LOC129286503 [Prosopis cineraria]
MIVDLKSLVGHGSNLSLKDDRFSVNLFSNLKELVVERCGSMRLVPFQVIRSLNSLEELQVTDCEKLEVVFDLEDLNDCEEGQSSSVVVPLKKLILENLPKLKNVWSNHHRGNVSFQTSRQIDSKNPLLSRNKDDRFSVNLFSNLKELDVGRCGFVILVPFQVLRSLHSLEVLLMNGCEELEVVFNLEDLNDCKEPQSSSVVLLLKNLSLWNLPKLKNVWSNHHRENVSFQSLRQIEVVNCGSLMSVFTASIARGMLHCLEQLVVRNCADMEVIVATDQVSESLDAAFVRPRLTCLELKHLPNLRNFYAQRHKLEWPHLHKLFIDDCDEIELFEKDVSSSSEVHGKEGTIDSKYPLLSCNKVIDTLEELKLCGKEAEMMGSGQFPTYRFPKVKDLFLITKKATIILYRSLLNCFPNLEHLQLKGEFKDPFRGHDVAALLFPFQKLTLRDIAYTISLGPSFVSLTIPNLTHLQVLSARVTTLLTSLAARSLVHLTHLTVLQCNQIEEIIAKQEGEDDEDQDIIFSKLERLQLYGLPKLKRFCGHNYTFNFPLLDDVNIAYCGQLSTFCLGAIRTPRLQSIKVDFKNKHIWKSDLNETIQYHFTGQQDVVNI